MDLGWVILGAHVLLRIHNYCVLKIKVLRTSEFKSHLEDYTETFNHVFSTQYTADFFMKKYSSGYYKNSFHALAFDKNIIVGSFSVIPYEYICSNNLLLGLGCDAFVTQSYRSDEFLLFNLFKAILPHLKEEGISSIISLPNPNASKYWKVFAKWKTIDFLKIQTLPINYYNLFPLALFYAGSLFISSLIAKLLTSNKDYKHVKLSRNRTTKRYPKGIYDKIGEIYVREMNEDGRSVVYLLNHSDLDFSNFYRECLKVILRYKNSDLLLIGANYNYPGLFTIPSKILKRKFPIMTFDLDNKFENEKDKFGIRLDLGSFDNR